MTDPLAWLYGLQSHGIKLGLEGIAALLELMGRPDRTLPCVLVGGTNGKGSVCAMQDAILRAHGRRCGLYTSPHLVRVNERIRIDGVEIADEALHRQLEIVRQTCARGLASGALAAHPSFFEVMTATAMAAFQGARLDVAVLEVGLGGRLDATNATEPVVSAIVTIALDHVETLGPTAAAIAAEKSGIARPGRVLVSGVSQPDARAVIEGRCRELGARFVDARSTELPTDWALPLAGAHQRDNARVALATFHAVADALGVSPRDALVREGLAATRWPGRIQRVAGRPDILLDGAHNPAGAEALAAHLASSEGTKAVLVFGAMKDKDFRGMLAPLAPRIAAVVATRPSVVRAAEPENLAAVAAALGLDVETRSLPGEALALARKRAGPAGLVLVAGSLYLVGEILALLEGGGAARPVSM